MKKRLKNRVIGAALALLTIFTSMSTDVYAVAENFTAFEDTNHSDQSADQTNEIFPGLGEDTSESGQKDETENTSDEKNEGENNPEDLENGEGNKPEDEKNEGENNPEDIENGEENKPEDEKNEEEDKPEDVKNEEENRPEDEKNEEENNPEDIENKEEEGSEEEGNNASVSSNSSAEEDTAEVEDTGVLNGAESTVSSEYTYTLSGEDATITKYVGSEEKVSIPEEIDGYCVVAIGSSAFKGNTSIKSVVIPSSVTTIGSNAFQNCTSLSGITLPESLTTIGSNAFYSATALTELTIPTSVTSIGNNAFNNSVQKIVFADGTAKIVNNACYGASVLETVTIPDTVTEIGNYAFYRSKKLNGIQLPENLTSIGNYAFYDCAALESIQLPDHLTTIGSNAFHSVTALTELTIPASVTGIGSNAFNNSVQKIVFADGTTEIVNDACNGASALETVTIPDTVTEIGSYAFYRCAKLNGIQLSENLTSIGNYAFSQCAALESIQLPDHLTTIGGNAFYSATALTELTIPASVTSIGNNAFNNSVQKIVFADGTTGIVNDACNGASALETVTIPDTVTEIGSYAFYRCAKLNGIQLSENLTSIGNYAFSQCAALESIQLPDHLTTIGGNAFYSATALTELTIPASVTSIGNNAFTKSVQKIVFADGTAKIVNNACYGASTLESVIIPDTVTEIGNYAFYGCTSLLSVILPKGLTTIENSAFYNCSGLEVVQIPPSIKTVGTNVFHNSAKSIIFADGTKSIPANICNGATNLKEVVFPNGLNTIGERAFYGCKLLEEVVLPEGTKTVGDFAFYVDSQLRVYVPESLTEVGNSAFFGCTLVKSCGRDAEWELNLEEKAVTIVGSGEIGDNKGNAFEPFVEDIQFVEIQEGITAISHHSFENMSQLVGVVIGDNVKEVGAQAFYNCDTLERVEFSQDLERIEEKAFQGCESIDTVIFTGSFPQIEETALPELSFTAYYPKSNMSYTESVKDSFSALTWKPWDDTLPKRDVVLVLDVSGSMSGSRIANLKSAVIAFAEKVGGRISNTRIGIVTYSSKARVVLPFSTDVTRMKASTGRMTADGGTYYLNGFAEAEGMLNSSDASVKSMILFSDGEPSDSRTSILNKAEEFRGSGYYMYSVGLTPSDANRQLLINIAGDESNYFQAEDIDALVEQFVEVSEGIGRSGSCGDNVKWKYNDSNKQLIISLDSNIAGSGKMYDYTTEELPAWNAYLETLEKIMIEKGVTYIGTNAFFGLKNVTRIQIDQSVTEIGSGAFCGCEALQDVYYTGMEEDWGKILIGDNNQPLLNAVIHYNSRDPEQSSSDIGSVTGVNIRPSTVTLGLGDNIQLEAEVIPKSAENKTVSWTSSDPAVATVGNTGRVKAVDIGTATITATTADGGFTSSCAVTVTNAIPVIDKLTLGGSQSGIKVDENIPLLGGKTFNIDLPASLPVSCVLEDDKIKVGINIKKENLYSANSSDGVTTTTGKKTIKQQFEDFKNDAMKADLMRKDEDWLKNVQDEKFLKANIPGMEKAVSLNCVGYAEAAWTDSLNTLQGSVVVTITGSATAQTQMVIWVIPVTVNCTFSASGSIGADVGYNFTESKWFGDLELAANLGIEPYAGVGFGQWFSGGVYGKGETDFSIVVMSSRKSLGLQNWTISGEMGLKGYFAKKSANIALIDGTYSIYPKEKSNRMRSNAYSSDGGTSLEDGVVITTLAAKAGIQNSVVGADGTLVSDVYNAAEPSLIAANGTTMLVYVVDDSARSSLNQTKLVYRIYDAGTGSYRDAVSVLDDGTADYAPEVFTDGVDIYVAWLDSTKIFGSAEDPELMDYMKTFRTHVAKYNPVSGSFEDLGSPQVKENYTYLPKMYAADGKLQLVWVENGDNALFGRSTNNTIRRAVYADGEWNVVDEISQISSVTSIDIGEMDSATGVLVAYALDQDNNFVTRERDLYLRSADGYSSKVNTGNIASVLFTELPGVDGKVLAANVDGGLYYSNGSSFAQLLPEGTMNIDTEFRVSGDRIVYLLSGKQKRNLAVSVFDNGEWGISLLTHEEAYVDSFSIMNGKVSYLKSNATHVQDGIWDVTSDIKMLESTEYDDVELETVDFALADAYAGATLPVELYIKNNGVSRVTKVHASVTYAGSEIVSSDVDVDIMPGETKPYDYSFAVPNNLSAGGDFTVTIVCDGDKNSGNNSQILSLRKADLEVRSSYDDAGDTPYIMVMVENRGLLDSNMEMTIKDEEGNLLISKKGLVKARDTVTFKEAYTGGKTQILTIEVKGDVEEFYEMNNVTWLQVGNMGVDEPQKSGIHIVGLEESYHYTGVRITPNIGVVDYDADGGRLLVRGVDYTVQYKNNTKVGTATITVTGIRNYMGKDISAKFVIKDADNAKVTLKSLKGAKITNLETKLTYDGEAKYPKFTLTLKGETSKQYEFNKKNNVYETADGEPVPANVALSNNINAGTATIFLTGDNGTKLRKSFKITAINLAANAAKVKVEAASGTYAVKGAAPASITVTYDGKKLKNGTDYTVKYSSNRKATTSARIVVTGKGNYAKKYTSATYVIEKLALSKVKVRSVTAYAGLRAGRVKATVVDDQGSVLKPSQYTLYVYKNKDDILPCNAAEVLTADSKIYVEAKAKDTVNLEGVTPRDEFTVGINIARAKVTNNQNRTITKSYTGTPIIFTAENADELKVTLNGITLKMGTDYEIVSYANNTNKGTATAVIKGIGSYSGTRTFKFKISAKQMQIGGVIDWDEISNLIKGIITF